MIALKLVMPNMPRFETVKVPPSISLCLSLPVRARSTRSRDSRAISRSALLLDGAQHGDDQAVVERDGDADVRALVETSLPSTQERWNCGFSISASARRAR